jgi:hypothetical protein
MTFGLFTVILALIGIGAVLGILYFIRQGKGKAHQNWGKSNPPPGALSSQSKLQEIEIPKAPTYQKTKEPMTHLRTEIDRLVDGFDIAFEKVRKQTDGKLEHVIEDDLKKMHHILLDARNAANILLAAVVNLPVDEIGKGRSDEVDQVITGPPPPGSSSLEDDHFRTLAVLRETINESKSCIAGFYFALTKKDESIRIAEASGQVELMVILFENAIAKIDTLENAL